MEDEIIEEEIVEEASGIKIPEMDENLAPEYEPNFNYNVKDEEREFDERLRGSVTSKESEDYLRDLYTRADGMESMKAKMEERNSYTSELEGTAASMTQGFKTLQGFRDAGDMRGLSKALGLKRDAILDYAEQLLDEDALPEEQKAAIVQNRDLLDKIAGLENKVSKFESDTANSTVDSEIKEMQSMIASEAYSPVANVMKEKGIDITTEIIREGTFEYHRSGVEPSIESVIQKVANKYNFLVPITEEETIEPLQKKVLPNVKPE